MAATFYDFRCYGLQRHEELGTTSINSCHELLISGIDFKADASLITPILNYLCPGLTIIFPLYPHNARILSITSTTHTANSIRNPLSRVTPRLYIR